MSPRSADRWLCTYLLVGITKERCNCSRLLKALTVLVQTWCNKKSNKILMATSKDEDRRQDQRRSTTTTRCLLLCACGRKNVTDVMLTSIEPRHRLDLWPSPHKHHHDRQSSPSLQILYHKQASAHDRFLFDRFHCHTCAYQRVFDTFVWQATMWYSSSSKHLNTTAST
jgi:hypothetical protein